MKLAECRLWSSPFLRTAIYTFIMAPRNRSSARRPLWIVILIAFVCAVGIGAYLYTPQHYTPCYLVSSNSCSSRPPPEPARVYTDDEIAARIVIRDIILAQPVQSKNPKIAFMFLTPSSLPFEKLWEKFFMVWYLRYCNKDLNCTFYSLMINLALCNNYK